MVWFHSKDKFILETICFQVLLHGKLLQIISKMGTGFPYILLEFLVFEAS